MYVKIDAAKWSNVYDNRAPVSKIISTDNNIKIFASYNFCLRHVRW